MVGKIISHYKIIEKIGEGGMGEVFLAQDLKLERNVAIKFLPQHLTKDKLAVKRFEREAKSAATLSHPNIVTIHEIAQEDDLTFIVMENINGKSLRDVIDQYNFGFEKALDVIRQLCEGLSKAHQTGIIHRDIKPENIMIDSDARVKILDFGLAKLKGTSTLTKESSTPGTVRYMSPEQIQGNEVDHRSDIWSIGVVFYEMLTGDVPFNGEYAHAVYYAILNDTPKELSAYQKELPIEIEAVVFKCLNKLPEERYESLDQLIVELRNISKKSKSKPDNIEEDPYLKKRKYLKQKPKVNRIFIISLIATISVFMIWYFASIFIISQDHSVNYVDSKSLRESIGIWDITFDNSISAELSQAFQDKLLESLIKTGVYEVFEKDRIISQFQSMGITIQKEQDIIENSSQSKISKLLQTNIVRISTESYSITLRIFNNQTGKVESSRSINTTGKIDEVLNQDIPLIVYKIVGRKTINIEVTEAGLKCDNKLIAYLDPLRSQQTDILIPELQNYLSKEVTKADSLISDEIINFLEVILRGDKNLKYDLFFKIVYTIIQSNISNIRLANLNPPFMVVPISLQPGQGDIETAQKLGFKIAITPGGFFLSFNSAVLNDSTNSELNFVVAKVERDSTGGYDFEQLNKELYDVKIGIKKTPKDIDSVIILANKNVEFGLVLSTANAIRSRKLENGEEYILFPSINFGQIME